MFKKSSFSLAFLLSALLLAPMANATPVLVEDSTFRFDWTAPSGFTSGFTYRVLGPNTGAGGLPRLGAEVEGQLVGGGVSVDLGRGPDADQFRFATSNINNYRVPNSGKISFSLTGLSFVGGPVPFSVDILSSSGLVNARVLNLTTSGFTVEADTTFVGAGPGLNTGFIIGRFAEAIDTTSPVPLPAGGVLLATGLVAFAAARRREKARA